MPLRLGSTVRFEHLKTSDTSLLPARWLRFLGPLAFQTTGTSVSMKIVLVVAQRVFPQGIGNNRKTDLDLANCLPEPPFAKLLRRFYTWLADQDCSLPLP